MNRAPAHRYLLCAPVFILATVACSSGSDNHEETADSGLGVADANAADAGPSADAGPCDPESFVPVCKDDKTFTYCGDDVDYDGVSDGPPRLIDLSCTKFFNNAGPGSCETFAVQPKKRSAPWTTVVPAAS